MGIVSIPSERSVVEDGDAISPERQFIGSAGGDIAPQAETQLVTQQTTLAQQPEWPE